MNPGRFDTIKTEIPDLFVLYRKPIADNRGYFERLYCDQNFDYLGLEKKIEQINHTLTSKSHSIRGMHFQYAPHSETKIVSCIRGAVFDVAVDIRRDSTTFMKWHAEILSDSNHRSLVIPPGFAHGFQTLVEDTELLYFHSKAYCPASEGGINPFDPLININWPHQPSCISERDSKHEYLDSNFKGVDL